MQEYYISRTIFFLLESSSQKWQEEHRHTDGREEQHRYAYEGEGCNGIYNCFLHIDIICKCINIDVYNFVAASAEVCDISPMQ